MAVLCMNSAEVLMVSAWSSAASLAAALVAVPAGQGWLQWLSIRSAEACFLSFFLLTARQFVLFVRLSRCLLREKALYIHS